MLSVGIMCSRNQKSFPCVQGKEGKLPPWSSPVLAVARYVAAAIDAKPIPEV